MWIISKKISILKNIIVSAEIVHHVAQVGEPQIFSPSSALDIQLE